METKVFKIDKSAPQTETLAKCAEIIRAGGLVAFPTETVYGLGANAFSEEAVKKLYEAKGRPPVKALSCCVSGLEQAEELAFFTPEARALFDAFLPGPLTIVLKKKPCVPDIVSAGLDTVGIRVPANAAANLFISLCGVPLAAPSANMSGESAPVDAAGVLAGLSGRIDALIDAGATEVGMESTIVSLVQKPVILRQGAVPAEKLALYLGL